MQEFLTACLVPGMYVSMPAAGVNSDVEDDLAFYQILALKQTVVSADRSVPLTVSGDSMYMEISVQPMDRMLPATAVEADVFSFADDLPMSMHVAIGSKDRARILQWDHVGPSSSYDDCISLREPKPIQPIKTTLLDLPTLSILDRLDASGWDGESRKTKHILEGAKVYDNRRPVSSRRYYQCLLVLDELLQPTESFYSGNSQAFYSYLLRFRKLPPAGATAKQLQAELKKASTDDEFDMGPQLPPLPLPAAEGPAASDFDDLAVVMDLPEHHPNSGHVSDSQGDQVAADSDYSPTGSPRSGPPGNEPVPGPQPPSGTSDAESEPPAEAVHEPCDASDTESELAVPGPVELIRADPDAWPLQLEGCSLIRIAGRRGGGRSSAIRLGVTCLCCSFFKSRSTALDVAELGPRAALWYLGAWMQHAGTADHRNIRPSIAEQQAYKSAHES